MFHSPNARVIRSRKLRWAGHVTGMEKSRCAFKILTGKPIEKRPLGRLTCKREENIRIIFEEMDINTRNWIDSA